MSKEDCYEFVKGMYRVDQIPQDILRGVVDIVWNTAQEAMRKQQVNYAEEIIEEDWKDEGDKWEYTLTPSH